MSAETLSKKKQEKLRNQNDEEWKRRDQSHKRACYTAWEG